jgi:hypothetical protein
MTTQAENTEPDETTANNDAPDTDAPNNGTPDTGAPKQAAPVPGACMACGHPTDDHDKISLRYCDATVEHALTRSCICKTTAATRSAGTAFAGSYRR